MCQNDLSLLLLQQICTKSNRLWFPAEKVPPTVCEPNCQGAFLAQNWFTTNRSELGTALQATRKTRRISKIIFWSGRGVQRGMNNHRRRWNDECGAGKVSWARSSQTPGPESWIWQSRRLILRRFPDFRWLNHALNIFIGGKSDHCLARVAKTCEPCQPVGAIFSGRC